MHIYIYIYTYEWRNCYIKLEITMTRKSGTHLHVTYRALNSCFDLIRSHQQCTPWSPPLGHWFMPRISNTELTSHGKLCDHLCVFFYRYVFPDTATSGATSSQVGVTSPRNINLMGRKFNYNYEWRNWYIKLEITKTTN